MVVVVVLAAVLLTRLVMNGVMFYILRTAVRTTEHQVKEHFVRALASYGEMVEEKQKESIRLAEQIQGMKKEASDMEEIIDVLKGSPFYQPHQMAGGKLAPLAQYVDKGFFDNYRRAKDLMRVLDKRKIIEEVKSHLSYKGDLERYETISKLLTTLDFDTVYQLGTVEPEEQLRVLDELLKGRESELFLEYVRSQKDPLSFQILSFLDWLRQQQSM